jgi:ABC-2 type transport system permease protein
MKNKIKNIKTEIKFAFFSIKQNLKNNSENRVSFFISLFGMTINNTAFLIIWMSFGKVAGNMGGWNYVDFLLANGLLTISFGIVYGFFPGVRYLPEVVKYGDLDKFLLSPRNFLLRLSTSKLETSAMGDLFFGVVCILFWAFLTANFSIIFFLNIIFFSVIASCIFYFFGVFANSLSFYFNDARTIVQGTLEMLLTPAIFYGGAFQGVLRNLFIFIVPAMLLGNLSVEIIKYPSLKMYLIVIFITSFWIFFSLWFFKKSLRKYESSSFINFG